MATSSKTLIGALEEVAQSINRLKCDQCQVIAHSLQEITHNTKRTDEQLQAMVTALQEIAQNARRTDDQLKSMVTALQEIAQNARRPTDDE